MTRCAQSRLRALGTSRHAPDFAYDVACETARCQIKRRAAKLPRRIERPNYEGAVPGGRFSDAD